MKAYTIEAASEFGIGGSVNGTGRRPRIHGFYVVSPEGRRVHAFRGKCANDAEARAKAEAWAKELTERYG